jgi:cytochrome b subunit of formate dehydrogenase
MMAVSVYHILSLLYRLMVRRVSPTMLPGRQDLEHLLQDIRFYLGRRRERAKFSRFSYIEKAEYFALVWGTIIMAVTGFLMWNPIAAARILPGETIPAAKAAHGGEALLAVLAVVLWHFYHVHLRHLNFSMFTGWLTRTEMEHEHPAELEAIEAGGIAVEPSPEEIRRRETMYIPIAALLALGLGFVLYQFITFEQTAIETVPPGESVEAFVPQTPTPAPTFAPTATSGEILADSWVGGFEGLFRDRCGTCHGFTTVGGLSLSSYEAALQGGDRGPAIVPRDPEASLLLQVQSAGDHPGQLSPEELEQVHLWIEAGAPER